MSLMILWPHNILSKGYKSDIIKDSKKWNSVFISDEFYEHRWGLVINLLKIASDRERIDVRLSARVFGLGVDLRYLVFTT